MNRSGSSSHVIGSHKGLFKYYVITIREGGAGGGSSQSNSVTKVKERDRGDSMSNHREKTDRVLLPLYQKTWSN